MERIKSFEQYQQEAMKTLSHEFHLIIQPELIHAVIGIVTEATEMQEAISISKEITGDSEEVHGFDAVNFSEEIGDAFWFVAVAFHYLDISTASSSFTKRVNTVDEIKRGDIEVISEMVDDLFINAGNALDIVKKAMFYNRAIDAEALKSWVVQCYELLLFMCDWANITPIEITNTNINKLRKRFPDKFDASAANNRDLKAERESLEADLQRGVTSANEVRANEGLQVMPDPELVAQSRAG